jgi:hypothetical protein
MTEDEFIKTISGDNLNKIIDTIYQDILKASDYGENLYKVTEEQKIVYHITRLESEICNGGLNQFFFNSSGQYATETLDSLRKIGATRTLSILEKAISFWPDFFVPKDTTTRRQELIEKIEQVADSEWTKLDKVYYQDEDKITEKLFQFIISKPANQHFTVW